LSGGGGKKKEERKTPHGLISENKKRKGRSCLFSFKPGREEKMGANLYREDKEKKEKSNPDGRKRDESVLLGGGRKKREVHAHDSTLGKKRRILYPLI